VILGVIVILALAGFPRHRKLATAPVVITQAARLPTVRTRKTAKTRQGEPGRAIGVLEFSLANCETLISDAYN
jgi:hypothetical protein